MDSVLNKVYYDLSSPACYSGAYSVYKAAKKLDPNIKYTDVEEFMRAQDTYTLHKPIKRKFKRNRIIAIGVDTNWQADLCDMQRLKKYNDGYAYILTVIDVFSKMAWAVPIKNKKPETVAAAFEKILNTSGRQPWYLTTDKGLEFVGKPFQELMIENLIDHKVSESPDIKAAVAERYNRTLKSRIWKFFTHHSTQRYVDALPQIVDAINNSFHTTIKCRPVDVNQENEDEVRKTLYGEMSLRKSPKYSIGDKVRIAKHKHTFKKGYLPNFTEEIFTIVEKVSRNPPVYRLEDYGKEPITGIFYENELVKVDKADDVFKVEKVIKTRKKAGKTEYLVKWLGYPEKFNQWIPKSDLKL